jgi:hypothetical protein
VFIFSNLLLTDLILSLLANYKRLHFLYLELVLEWSIDKVLFVTVLEVVGIVGDWINR